MWTTVEIARGAITPAGNRTRTGASTSPCAGGSRKPSAAHPATYPATSALPYTVEPRRTVIPIRSYSPSAPVSEWVHRTQLRLPRE